jgi:hypothetical protein
VEAGVQAHTKQKRTEHVSVSRVKTLKGMQAPNRRWRRLSIPRPNQGRAQPGPESRQETTVRRGEAMSGGTPLALVAKLLQSPTTERYAQILLHERQKPGANDTTALNQKLVGLLNACRQLGGAPPRTLIDLIARQRRVGNA